MKVCLKVSLLIAAVAVQSSFASVALITTRAGLSGSDSLLISTIGLDGTTQSSGFSAGTALSNTVTFTGGADGFTVLTEGPSGEWSGNFANNELILWTSGDAVPVTMSFSSLVAGVGMQIQPDEFTTGFTASIDAYDSGNNDIGSFTETGNSTLLNNGSAMFLGVLSTSTNIKKITINITSPTGLDYAFDSLTFGAPVSGVPEPSTFFLFLAAAGLWSSARTFRRRE